MLRFWTLAIWSALALAAPAAATVLVAPTGADNLEFAFAQGKCTDAIRIHNAADLPITLTTYGCSNSVKKFAWASNNATDKFDLYGIFQKGSPETVGRSTLVLVDAYWTSGPAFLQPVWPTGSASDYVVIIPASAIPEPDTWAMLLLGFSMVGFAMRKRSNVSHGTECQNRTPRMR